MNDDARNIQAMLFIIFDPQIMDLILNIEIPSKDKFFELFFVKTKNL